MNNKIFLPLFTALNIAASHCGSTINQTKKESTPAEQATTQEAKEKVFQEIHKEIVETCMDDNLFGIGETARKLVNGGQISSEEEVKQLIDDYLKATFEKDIYNDLKENDASTVNCTVEKARTYTPQNIQNRIQKHIQTLIRGKK